MSRILGEIGNERRGYNRRPVSSAGVAGSTGRPQHHRLKTLKPFLDAVGLGFKTFEVRRDDRGFRVGDWLELREWDAEREAWGPGNIICRISYILEGGQFGVEPGHVVLGIKLPANHSWPPRR